MVVKVVMVMIIIVYRRTDLTFKLDFSSNFCRAAFAILAMFSFETSKWWMTSPNFQKSHCFFLLQATQIDCQPVKSFWITLKTLEFYEELHIRHFCHNINEITIGAGKRKVKTLSNECGVKSERLVVNYCFLLPSDVSTRVPISGCRFSYHSHFSRHSQTTIVPLATRGASFTQKKNTPHSTWRWRGWKFSSFFLSSPRF